MKTYSKLSTVAILAWFLVFCSELLLSIIWLLDQAFRWRPITRTVFPEYLPKDLELPAIDVFICTVDPKKEPTVEVMNTVLSAMALDYPPESLNVYLSDDGGSSLTLSGIREARAFAGAWVPFCRKYNVKTRYPEGYFSSREDDDGDIRGTDFRDERQKVQEKYEEFKERVAAAAENGSTEEPRTTRGRGHPPSVEVIRENTMLKDQILMPRLVYVSREKRPSHPHHFKAGALNVLLRVSSMISNSPYILVLDCDMHCNDSMSARQAMCFHLDPKLSSSLAFVQFPQKFHNISKNDIYDSQHRSVFTIQWQGTDGIMGPILSGTGFYIKRRSLYGNSVKGPDLVEHKESFGSSKEFVQSLDGKYRPNEIDEKTASKAMLQETHFLASSSYEQHTGWGEKVGFLYYSVAEDYFTGFNLHCKGWKSVYCDPPRPAFLGSGTTNLNDLFIQGTRWSSGLLEVTFSKFCPIIYGFHKISLLQSMCYTELATWPLYFVPIWCFATIPQLFLLNGIPLYPEVSNLWFVLFPFIFVSSISKHLQEVLSTGGSLETWINEHRMWMIKSLTCHLYGSLDAIMKNIGLREASFIPTNKVIDEERIKRYEKGMFDFQTSNMFLVPLVTIVIVNMISLVGGIAKVLVNGNWNEMFVQVFIIFYSLMMSYPIIEGMILRKDKGRIQPYTTKLSIIYAMTFVIIGSVVINF